MGLFNGKKDLVLDSLITIAGGPYTLGLSTTEPHDDGTVITPPSGGYSAQAAVSGDFHAASGGTKTNHTAFQFGPATVSWGSVGWWVLYDNGTPILWGILSPAKTIDMDDILRIPEGQMSITAD